MRILLFTIVQCTWGFPQTLAGLFVFLSNLRRPHQLRHGTVTTHWRASRGLSLGLFVFLPEGADDKLFVHEFGHCIQSLALGPLYLPVVGVASACWSMLPVMARRRIRKGIPYYAFITERTADKLGERVLHRPAMGAFGK